MVLQREVDAPIWGWGDPGETIRVDLDGRVYTTKVDQTGEWSLTIDPQEAGGPWSLSIFSRTDTMEFSNVLFGDVWLCSGQSNMEWPIKAVYAADSVMRNANFSQIRHFNIPSKAIDSPQSLLPDNTKQWEVCTPEVVGEFTGVGYFFAHELHTELDVPIGLIHSSWGGSGIQSWMNEESLSKPQLKGYLESITKLLGKEKKQKELELEELHEIPDDDPGIVDGEAVWAATGLDDSTWKEVEVPGNWQPLGLGTFDGIIWYRKTFELSEIPESATLALEAIDDGDETWINGVKVGATPNAWNKKRAYEVDPSILKKGENQVTIRIEDVSWGGGVHGNADSIGLFTDNEMIPLKGKWKFHIGEFLKNPFAPNNTPSLLYNAMIHPIKKAAVKGTIWYQGEANSDSIRAFNYRFFFEEMITSWRRDFNQPDMPFLWAQLANYQQPDKNPSPSYWALTQESQSYVLDKLGNTGQAVIIDVGDANDIHPRDKKTVGYRLAQSAKAIAYGQDIVYSSPQLDEVKIEGEKVMLTFNHTGSGLVTRDGEDPAGFAIAGSDGVFKWANAELIKNTIILTNKAIPSPKYVRYAWANNPIQANVYNKEGFPMGPFRTDEFDY